ncbi:hypothetical protein PTKIN_Ptkin12aG0051300 [Pterospermum kingtungense]
MNHLHHHHHHHHRFLSSLFIPLSIFFVLIQVILEIPLSLGDTEAYETCRDARFKCGNISAGYPFSWDGIPLGCGQPDLQLLCENDTTTVIEIDDVRYEVLDILPIFPDGQTLRIARQDYINNDSCNPGFQNRIPGYGPFQLVNASDHANVTLLYDCRNLKQRPLGHFNCSGHGDSYKDIWVVSGVPDSVSCSARVTVPIKHRPPLANIPSYSWLLRYLQQGFDVKWKEDSGVCETCKATGGACGFNIGKNRTICYCPDTTLCYCPNPTNTWGWEELEECPRLAPTLARGKYFNFSRTSK